MSQSLACVTVHIVFSTKARIPLISLGLEERLKPFLGGILRSEDCPAIAIGGAADHMHTLCYLSRTISIADLVGRLKGRSSSWIGETFRMPQKFGWQGGYAAFSVSPSDVRGVADYIKNQREHHRRRGFQEELRELLKDHGMDFDEKYLWD